MASTLSVFSSIQLEIELMDAGKRLLLLPSSCPELLNVLTHMERTLSRVQQLPSESMKYAIHPIIDALIAKELVRHPDMNVNILVACCICEVLRIMAPNPPYNNQQMKDFIELGMMTFKKLSSSSSGCYTRMTKVLKTFTSARLSVLMLDLQLDKLVVQLFKQFLTVADSNSYEVVNEMEKIMTMIIQKSEPPKLELRGLLVMSVRNYNQINSPVCWQLGEKVLKNCTNQLKQHLPNFIHKMGIPLLDLSKIVSHICNMSENETMVTMKKEVQSISNPISSSRKVNPVIPKIEVHDHIPQKTNINNLLSQKKGKEFLTPGPPTPSKSQKKVKTKRKRNFTHRKKQGSKMAGENLVGNRIKVWWPLDNMYYEGVAVSFDQSTRRHKICYDDGDEEILNLKQEKWELVKNELPRKVWSSESYTRYVKGYKVKNNLAPILESIFMKHGDIASECLFKTVSVRASFLEIVCEIVTWLKSKTNDDKFAVSEMEEIQRKISEVEKANINVMWIRSYLEVMKKSSLLMEMKEKMSVVMKYAEMEVMDAQERVENAKRCVKVVNLVGKKISNNILECKNEDNLFL